MKFADFLVETEVEPQQYPLTAKEVEDMAQRIYNINREFYQDYNFKSWRDWLAREDPENLADTFSGWYQQLEKYLSKLPEDISMRDLIRAYKEGKLQRFPEPYRHQPLPIDPTGNFQRTPWSPPARINLSDQEAKEVYLLATQRPFKATKEQVSEARKKLFLLFYSDPQLAQRLGISKTELGKRIRSYAGYSATARDMEQGLNRGVPEEHQWAGLTNSAYLSRISFKHEDLESLVKQIEVTDGGVAAWRTDRGTSIRDYIGRTFLGIDSNIQYKDLSFKVGSIEPKSGKKYPPRGQYQSQKKQILISDLNPHTVSHEIGHYLDYKFAEELGYNYTSLSAASFISVDNAHLKSTVPLPRLEWAEKFRKFVHNLMDKSDLYSEYTQDPGEVFARFIDFFCQWTEMKAYGKKDLKFVDNFRDDKFTESDCRVWVRLLQEKSFLDAKYPIKRRGKK